MKIKNLTILMTVLTLFVLTIIGSFVLSRSATAQKDDKTQNLTNQTKIATFSANENKAKKQISDQVAYELFLRTVGEFNAKGLVERAGFDENEVEKIVGEAKSLNGILNSNDENARRIKENKNNLTGANVKNELAKIQATKAELVDRTVNRFLRGSLRAEGFGKLQNFIDSQVKKNIQVVPKPKSSGKDEAAFIKTSTKSSAQASGNLYLYSAAWQDGTNVFGAGTLSEQYSSDTSYHITTTVTSPSGRANTTESDWNYATLSQNTGLSMGVEDGTYTIQSSFEQADGYYDEYGNFVGTGSTNVGNSLTSLVLAPQLTITAIATPTTISSAPTSLTQRTSNVFVTISATAGVPQSISIQIEYSPTGSNVQYTIDAPALDTQQGTGGTIMASGQNRVVDVLMPSTTVSNGERSIRIKFPVVITRNSPSGMITSVITHEPPNPEVTVMPNATFAGPSITVNAPVAGGGGGGGGGNAGCPLPSTAGPDGVRYCPPGSSPQGYMNLCCGYYSSPLLLDIDGDGYEMTDYYYGVPFDVAGKGYATQTSWTAANSDDAWLVLDRNENNRIDNGMEMFGDASEQAVTQNQRNGFASLAVFDTAERGGNADGKITRRDAVFRKLRLWQDRNHNGISEPEEMSRLPALDVVAVFLDYRESRRTDQYGNRFKFRAKVRDRNDARVGRWAWDVFLVIAPPN